MAALYRSDVEDSPKYTPSYVESIILVTPSDSQVFFSSSWKRLLSGRVGSTTPFVYILPRDRDIVRKLIKLIFIYLTSVSNMNIHSLLH